VQIRAWAGAALVAAAVGSPVPVTGAGRAAPVQRVAATVTVGDVVRVDVSVATLWVSPSSPRPVDRPALQDPVNMRRWLGDMSTDARRALVGRVETQALYGERLTVLGVWDRWLRVVAPGQPTSRDARGYPGWVPRRQVTTAPTTASARVATVVARHTWLKRTDGSREVAVGYGTRLPVLAVGADTVAVAGVTGRRLRVPGSAVVVAARGAPPRPATRRSVLADAMDLRGVPDLWGGRSGWALDCSGFTGLVYSVHGVRLPRDADDQARRGSAVPLDGGRRADLAFFQRGDSIGHVGFLTGDGRLLHAPSSGQVVSVVPLQDVSGLVRIRSYL
jgi:cell wall-associated NlpC family hydrolase